MPHRRRRKRAGTSTAPGRPTADAPNRVWAVDFQFHSTTDGRPVKIVSMVDEHTREAQGGLVERSVTGGRLATELDRIAAYRGYPGVLRCDNGLEMACQEMADWAAGHVGLSFIPPGETWRNGYIESFNSRIRDECLNINLFWSLTPSPRRHHRLERPVQPPPPTQLTRLLNPGRLRCQLHPHTTRTNSHMTRADERGPVNFTRSGPCPPSQSPVLAFAYFVVTSARGIIDNSLLSRPFV